MNIYTPYFYVIQHIASGKYYAGYKAGRANSSSFMTPGGYTTSSKPVKAIIATEGLNAFKVVKMKHFETKAEAFDYETRFLKKVGVPYNPRFLNQHVTTNFGGMAKGKKLGPRGPRSAETIAKIKATRKGKKLGPQNPEHIANISAARKGQKLSPEHIAKIKASMMGKNRGPQSPEHYANRWPGRCKEDVHTKMNYFEAINAPVSTGFIMFLMPRT